MLGGAQVFVSHSSGDTALIEALVANLRRRGFDSLFIDFDPVGGIPPGRNWERELYTALRRCDAVAAIDTPAWRTSQWCFAEVALARSLGKTVIVIQVGKRRSEISGLGAAALTADTQRVVIEELTEAACEPLFRELTQLGLGQLRPFRWKPDRLPYAGLSPLQEEDAGVFFGRREETRTAVDLIEKLAKYREKRMVLLIGPSGSGKSSLLHAGVIPQFRQRPGWNVIGPNRIDAGAMLRVLDGAPAGQNSLLPLDQIDEALTQEGDDLIALLTEVVERGHGSCLAVGTLRGESLTVFHERFGSLSPLIEKFVVGPLTRADYRDIIELPAKIAGGSVEPNLLDALLADVASSGAATMNRSKSTSSADRISADALPLLAVMLRQLWEQRNKTNELTLAAYERMGRLEGAIQRTADAVMAASALSAEDLWGIRRAFLGMVRIDREGRVTRRPLRLSELQSAQLEVLQRFVNEGLLVIGSTPGAIDLAHEALIRTWKDLASWVEDAREDLLRLERFEVALAQWRENREAVLQAIGLVEAEDLVKKGYDALRDPDAVQLLELSREARDTALAREHERLQSIRISESLRLASEARAASPVEPETALLVAWEAVLWDRNELTEAAFREALTRTPAPVKILCPASRNLYISAGFSGEGTLVFATDSQTGAVATWTTNGRPVRRFQVPGEGPLAIAGLPRRQEILTCRDQVVRLHAIDGRIIDSLALGTPAPNWFEGVDISVAADCTALIHANGQGSLVRVNSSGNQLLQLIHHMVFAWSATGRGDVAASDFDGPLHPPLSRVFHATLDSEARTVLTEASDSARVWSTNGTLQQVLDIGGVSAGEFLAEGLIATGTMRGSGQIWGNDGQLLTNFKNGTDGLDVFISAVAPDGDRFAATVNQSGIVEIWSANGELEATLRAHKGHAWSAAFSPDGRYLASGGADHVIRIWDWREERCVFDLHGHTANVNLVKFHNSDPTLLLSVCQAGEVRLWTLDNAVIPPLRGHERAVEQMALTAAGVLSSATDGTSRLWRFPQGDSSVVAGKIISLTDGPERACAFTADGSNVVHLWSWDKTGTPACHCEFRPHSRKPVVYAAASPDLKRAILLSESEPELWSDWGEHLGDLIGEKVPGTDEQFHRIRWCGFSRDGSRIVTASVNGMVWLWSADGSPESYFLADNASPDRIFDVELDPEGDYILIGVRNHAGLWTWQGDPVLQLPSSGYKVQKVRFTPDGSRIITIADDPSGAAAANVDLWDRAGRHLASRAMRDGVDTVFDPLSRYFCLRSSTGLRIFDLYGQPLGTLAAASGTDLRDVAISADGNFIAALFSDHKARLWEFEKRRRAGALEVAEANRILFTPDGRRLLAGSPVGQIEQYPLDITELFPIAAERIDRMLTPDELDRFAIQRPTKLKLDRFRMTLVSVSG